LKDVAGMVRSFHYAAHTALSKEASVRPEDTLILEPWANLWYRFVSRIFVQFYVDTIGKAPLIPGNPEDLQVMLKVYLLEKAVYELAYELNHRPEWIMLPIKGIKDLLEGG